MTEEWVTGTGLMERFSLTRGELIDVILQRLLKPHLRERHRKFVDGAFEYKYFPFNEHDEQNKPQSYAYSIEHTHPDILYFENSNAEQIFLSCKETDGVKKEKNEQLVSVSIPLTLLAGKSPEVVFAELSILGHAECVIASALMSGKAGKIGKTDAGRLFYQADTEKGIIHDPKTYRDRIDRLEKECKNKYLLTLAK